MRKWWIILLIVLGVLITAGVIVTIVLKRLPYYEPMDGPGMVYEVVVDEIEYVETNHITGATYRLYARRDGGVHLTLERKANVDAEPVVLEIDADIALLTEIGDVILQGGLEAAGNYPERDPYRMPDVTSRLKVTEPYRTFTVTTLMELSEREQTAWNEVVRLLENALNEPTYPVDYGTQIGMYANAQSEYAAGESVVLYVDEIATDTDYSFLLDGESLNYSYDDSIGFVISFIMPDHSVKLECVMKNSMMYEPDTQNIDGNEEKSEMVMRIGDTTLKVEWEDNESVAALREFVSEKGGIAIQMSMYGDFEQVGSLGTSLPRSDEQTTTQAGDIVLYSGNQIVVFYGSNSWAYTRLGRITDKTAEQMKELLGNGDITILISFE